MTAPEATDAELIRAHATGDPHAFSELVRRHRDRMWAVALRTMRDQEEAADALQDACVSAFRAAAKFRAESAVSTWLHRIVVNACLDRIRRRQTKPTVSLPESGPGEPAVERDSIAERETGLVVRQALDELPEQQRSPILLVDVEGYSVGDAAVLLGVAEGTVKSRCARGRTKLAKVLGHLRNPDEETSVTTHESKRDHDAGRQPRRPSPDASSRRLRQDGETR